MFATLLVAAIAAFPLVAQGTYLPWQPFFFSSLHREVVPVA